MKKFLSLLSAAIFLLPFICVNTPEAKAVSFPLKSSIRSESAVLINLDADTIIHEKNADTKQMPGPLVNIMTAVVVLEECTNISEELTLDPAVYGSIYDVLNANDRLDDLPSCDISDGDILTVEDLLHCMMLTSSIEASNTLAFRFGGNSVTKFVEKMNAKAKEIGMTSTNFTNPDGMFDVNQYTTARDMAILTQYALDVPRFEAISVTYSYTPTVPNPERHEHIDEWIWKHTNFMMDPGNETYFYMGAKGVKTGNLIDAGRNLITLASKDGNNYLAVLMKAPFNDADGNLKYYHIEDARYLFDWAFNNFSYQTILADTAEVGELPVKLAEGNDYVLARPKEEFTMLWYDESDVSLIKKDKITWYNSSLTAPVKKGDVLGEVTLEYSGEELGTIELVAVSDVERSKSKYNLEVMKRFPKSTWFKNALKISIILCLIYIVICIYAWAVYKSKGKPMKPIYAVPKMDKKKKENNKNQDSKQ